MPERGDDLERSSVGGLRRDEIAVPLGVPAHLRKPRLRRPQVAEYLAAVHGIEVAASTLAKWAGRGLGPAFARLHRTPWYDRLEVDRWVAATLKPAAGVQQGTRATTV